MPNTKNAPKRCVIVFEGRGCRSTRNTPVCVFSGRKVSEHVRHAHTGMPYVFCRMWEVGVGSWTQKTRPFRVCGCWQQGGQVGGVSRGDCVLTRRDGGVVVVRRGNDVGHAHTDVSYMFGRRWEVGVVPDTKKAPIWARFSCVSCFGKEGRGWGCCGLDSH